MNPGGVFFGSTSCSLASKAAALYIRAQLRSDPRHPYIGCLLTLWCMYLLLLSKIFLC